MAEPDPTIVEWVIAARDNGDQQAFAELVYTYQDAVYNLCYRMLSERMEAEDATQEAFMKAYNNLYRYDTNRSFKTWVMSIASNHCIDQIRKRRLKYLSLDEPLPGHMQLSLGVEHSVSPEREAQRNERGEYIQDLLDQLSEDDRVGIVLKYWYDYSYAEIADVLDTTESAIKSRLFRARRALADLITNDPDIDNQEDAINRLSEL